MAGHTVAASTGLVNAVGTGTRVPQSAGQLGTARTQSSGADLA